MKQFISILSMLIVLVSCKRDTKEPKCTLKIVPLSSNIAAYNFKEGSNWTYKLKDSSRTGTIHFQSSYVSSISIKGYGKGATPCDSFARFAYTELTLRNSLAPNHDRLFTYYLCDNVMCLNRLTDRGHGTQVYAWQYTLTDTTYYTSDHLVTKVYQEKIIDNMIIFSNTYTNVHQVYYYPSYSGFKRVWWCEGIGFVKLEYINPVSNLTETWELQSYNVVF